MQAAKAQSSHSSEGVEEPSRMSIAGIAKNMRSAFNQASQPERPRAQTGLTDVIETLAIEEDPDTRKAREMRAEYIGPANPSDDFVAFADEAIRQSKARVITGKKPEPAKPQDEDSVDSSGDVRMKEVVLYEGEKPRKISVTSQVEALYRDLLGGAREFEQFRKAMMDQGRSMQSFSQEVQIANMTFADMFKTVEREILRTQELTPKIVDEAKMAVGQLSQAISHD